MATNTNTGLPAGMRIESVSREALLLGEMPEVSSATESGGHEPSTSGSPIATSVAIPTGRIVTAPGRTACVPNASTLAMADGLTVTGPGTAAAVPNASAPAIAAGTTV